MSAIPDGEDDMAAVRTMCLTRRPLASRKCVDAINPSAGANADNRARRPLAAACGGEAAAVSSAVAACADRPPRQPNLSYQLQIEPPEKNEHFPFLSGLSALIVWQVLML